MKTNTALMPRVAVGVAVVAAVLAVFASFALFVHADTAPSVTMQTYNSSNVLASSANIGVNVYATAQIATSGTTTLPTGTITFNRYAGVSCVGTATVQSGVALVNGFATSSQTAQVAGGISYSAHYSGDAFNVAVDGPCIPIAATANNVTLTGVLSTTTSVLTGSSVSESSTLAGATANAGGSVAYNVYSNNSCTTLWSAAGNKSVTNASVPNSDSVQFNTAGTYFWQGVYSGDASNNTATTSCLTLSVVNPSNTASAVVSGTVYNDLNSNSSKDGGENGVSGLTVNLYQGSGFGGIVYRTTTTDGNGNYSLGTLADGTYSVDLVTVSPWQQETADYNSVVITGQASLTNTNFAIHNPTTTTPGAGSISGTVYKDANKDDKFDSGDSGLSGFTVNLYANAGWWGMKGTKDPVKTAVSDGNGAYSFTNLADGTYSVELIEQKKNGWNQSTDDFKSLVIKNGSVLSGKDFGNTAIATSTNHDGNGNNGNDDHDNNGNHWGWFKNLGNLGGWHFGWGK